MRGDWGSADLQDGSWLHTAHTVASSEIQHTLPHLRRRAVLDECVYVFRNN
jgi:hypothetical protein